MSEISWVDGDGDDRKFCDTCNGVTNGGDYDGACKCPAVVVESPIKQWFLENQGDLIGDLLQYGSAGNYKFKGEDFWIACVEQEPVDLFGSPMGNFDVFKITYRHDGQEGEFAMQLSEIPKAYDAYYAWKEYQDAHERLGVKR